MLLIMTKSKRDFELVQAYLSTCLIAHGKSLWTKIPREEASALDELLAALHNEVKSAWDSVDTLVKENTAMIKWVSSALL